jgi:Do/DeqQ family serine protease
MKKILGLFLIATVAGFAAVAAYAGFNKKEPQVVQVIQQQPTHFTRIAPTESNTLDFTVAAERTVNAVVHVRTQTELNPMYNPWMEFFGHEDVPQIQQGSGSGVIISPNGYIVTNNHVIDGAKNIMIKLNDNRSYEAEIIGVDPATDLALLKVNADNLPTVSFGNSEELDIGEWVLAVGNPFDLTSTVTAGIVSAKARNINLLRPDVDRKIFPIESFIQTDAAVNPGNSGGALVDTNGNLVGINTAIASRTGSYSGYSFAIPVSIVEKVTRDLMEFGDVQRAFIGVRINDVNEELATELGLEEVTGVYVDALIENGAASDAGIQPGDVIVKVGKTEVGNVPELQEQVSRYRPGDELGIEVLRDGDSKNLFLTLRDRDGGTELGKVAEKKVARILGAQLVDVSSSETAALGIQGGAKVTSLESGKFSTSGIEKGFIITKVDGQKVYDADDVTSILKSKSGGVLIEGIYPNGDKAYYGFGM